MGAFTTFVALLVLACFCSAQFFKDPDSEEYGQFKGPVDTTCTCGTSYKAKSRIVNGVETKENEYTYMVGIMRKPINRLFCGGSIIAERTVLTAAHCIEPLNSPNDIYISAGGHDLRKPSQGQLSIDVVRFIVHPQYNNRVYQNDIALLITKNIPFSNTIRPVCMPTAPMQLEGKLVKVKGWGRLYSGGIPAQVLRKVWLQVSNLGQCSAKYPRTPINVVNPTQFCTLAHGKDACQGDSGGPLTMLDPDTNRYTQVGVVSYGYGCATPGYPGVNTDVTRYLPWINSNIRANGGGQTCTKRV